MRDLVGELNDMLDEAMTLRDVAKKHAPDELKKNTGETKMVFGRLVKVGAPKPAPRNPEERQAAKLQARKDKQNKRPAPVKGKKGWFARLQATRGAKAEDTGVAAGDVTENQQDVRDVLAACRDACERALAAVEKE